MLCSLHFKDEHNFMFLSFIFYWFFILHISMWNCLYCCRKMEERFSGDKFSKCWQQNQYRGVLLVVTRSCSASQDSFLILSCIWSLRQTAAEDFSVHFYSRFLLKTCGILAKGTFTLHGVGKCPAELWKWSLQFNSAQQVYIIVKNGHYTAHRAVVRSVSSY